MMAVVWRVMLVLLPFSISLRIKKCSFIGSDSIMGEEANEYNAGETLLWSSHLASEGSRITVTCTWYEARFLFYFYIDMW